MTIISEHHGPGSSGHHLSEPSSLVGVDAGGVRLDLVRLSRVLVWVAVCLVVLGAAANVVIYQLLDDPNGPIGKVVRRFDLGFEPSIPAWYSSMVLLLNGFWLLLIGAVTARSGRTFRLHWLVLGFIFIGLSIDETVMFHEMINRFMTMILPGTASLPLPWVLAGGLFAAVIFVSYLRFLGHLDRRFQLLFVLSGALFVGGAVGVEVIAGEVIDRFGVESLYHTVIQTVEEGLEMAGSILFFYGLGQYWQTQFAGYPLLLDARQPPADRVA